MKILTRFLDRWRVRCRRRERNLFSTCSYSLNPRDCDEHLLLVRRSAAVKIRAGYIVNLSYPREWFERRYSVPVAQNRVECAPGERIEATNGVQCVADIPESVTPDRRPCHLAMLRHLVEVIASCPAQLEYAVQNTDFFSRERFLVCPGRIGRFLWIFFGVHARRP